MPVRFGPGPVFIYESIAAARRWQFYALRSLFVFGLLAALALVWYAMESSAGALAIQRLAALGLFFYIAIATVQLALVLLVAPAATAGAICVDRARGALTHMCVTDLTSSEIVLGKLAARLAPVFGLVAAAVPVLALAGLLGGIVLEAIAMLTAITIVLAIFACALALAFSVRATKVHDVLMAVYAIEAAWILGPVMWYVLEESSAVNSVPNWYTSINPFVLAWAPYAWPKSSSAEWLLEVLGVTLLFSCALILYAVLRLRADLSGRTGSRSERLSRWLGKARARLAARVPSPSLDINPVFWREWRRSRSSRLTRIVWSVYAALALGGTAWGISLVDRSDANADVFLAVFGGLQATIGLLLVSLSAPTAMAEERACGTLEVLLTTPLETSRIVLAKWWGAYRTVLALVVLPAVGAAVIAAVAPGTYPLRSPNGQKLTPLTWIDQAAFVCIPIAMFLAQGAMVTTVGLALGTWIKRVGRAVAVSVATYGFFAFGLLLDLELEIIPSVLGWLGLYDPAYQNSEEFVSAVSTTFCPFGGQAISFLSLEILQPEDRYAFYIAQIIVLLATLGFSLFMMSLTLVTFDRAMGRMPERPRRAPRPPVAAPVGRSPHQRRQRRAAALETAADRFTSAAAAGPTHP
jgi:ABC-type transport system involved in multi-copper enzyme maturation permease subunit